MEQIAPYLNIVVLALDLVSILVIVWGVVLSLRDFFALNFVKKEPRDGQRMTKTKNLLARYVLYGLELLIAADIIATIINPTMEDIILLGVIVAIRTVISVFLNRELREEK